MLLLSVGYVELTNLFFTLQCMVNAVHTGKDSGLRGQLDSSFSAHLPQRVMTADHSMFLADYPWY